MCGEHVGGRGTTVAAGADLIYLLSCRRCSSQRHTTRFWVREATAAGCRHLSPDSA